MTGLGAIRWTARVLSIVSFALLLAFMVGEGVDPARVAPEEWIGLLLFPFGVMLGMTLAWWHEGIGGGLVLASLLAFFGAYGLLLAGVSQPLPFVLFGSPGFLFLLYWLLSRSGRRDPGRG